MTDKPAGNGPTAPRPDETPQGAEARQPQDETRRLPDDTIPLRPADGPTAGDEAATSVGTAAGHPADVATGTDADTKVEPAAGHPAGADAEADVSDRTRVDTSAGTGADAEAGEPRPEPAEAGEPRPEPAEAGGTPPGGYPPPSGGFPPPGGGFPPPSGSFFPPPQPTGGAFATKYGLIRPVQGRWFAGVAAAIGRATNTDPVLWRVLLGVLILFGGVGLLIYVLGWLLIPAEGDTGSAAEALIGRGHSSTSAPLALGLAVLAVVMFGVAFSNSVRTALLGAAVILGAAALVSRGGSTFGRPANTPPQPGGPVPPPPGAPFAPPAGAPFAPPAGVTTPFPSAPTPFPAAGSTMSFPPAGATTSFAAGTGAPTARTATEAGTGEAPAGYRPPFAPHGPYASSSPYAQSLGYGAPPPPQYPGLAPPAPPRPPKPPRERSRLGRVVLSLTCLALGALVVTDVAGESYPASAYIAVPLAVIGLGLVVGAWLGRARWLIFPGMVLLVALPIVATASNWHIGRPGRSMASVSWAPTSVSELNSTYRTDGGDATLDLSQIDFRDRSADVTVRTSAGKLVVILPPNVDVDVTAQVDAGSADVLGQSWGGLGTSTHEIHDNGADGPGGGQLRLTASVDLGKLEVHR
ncbi:PspC domain-containing protein [Planosporangium sp. 12N6]|uniref:PspC domain-containing protein n=1 Tax=Planosporangium spinosum TaxID=3402278 RepID=UPI003CF49CF7